MGGNGDGWEEAEGRGKMEEERGRVNDFARGFVH
jgi:hypothetical protein